MIMMFRFSRGKPIKEGKLLETFLWKFLQVVAKIDGKNRGALEATWVPVDGVQLPSIYFFEWVKQ